jgi:asparagine synthase (glutamine-hydrolysing)
MNIVPADKIPILKNKYNFHNRYEKLKGVLMDSSAENIMLSLSQPITESSLRKLMVTDFSNLSTFYQSKELQKEFYTPLSYIMAIDYQTYLVDDILQKVDRATMSCSLEGREPLLDHRVIEWAAKLPNDYKYHNGVKKYILREIAHQYIPKKLLDRPKMGFGIPIGKWLQNDLRNLLESYLSKENIVSHGIFDWNEVNHLKTAFLNGKVEYHLKIWYLLMFEMWYEKWMH